MTPVTVITKDCSLGLYRLPHPLLHVTENKYISFSTSDQAIEAPQRFSPNIQTISQVVLQTLLGENLKDYDQ